MWYQKQMQVLITGYIVRNRKKNAYLFIFVGVKACPF